MERLPTGSSWVETSEAILTSAEDVGRACLLTSITTFVGFVSISLIPTPVFRELGWVLGMGVATALLLAMTLVPIFADMGPEPDPKTLEMDNVVARIVDKIVTLSARISTQFPRRVILIFTVFTGAVVYNASTHSIETDFLKRFDQDNVIPQDNASSRPSTPAPRPWMSSSAGDTSTRCSRRMCSSG